MIYECSSMGGCFCALSKDIIPHTSYLTLFQEFEAPILTLFPESQARPWQQAIDFWLDRYDKIVYPLLRKETMLVEREWFYHDKNLCVYCAISSLLEDDGIRG